MRFRTEQHLRRQSDIRGARETGARLDCRAYTIWWRHRPATPAPAEAPVLVRAVFVASIAAVGPAVRRNRAKRRLREIFRRHQELLPQDCDLLLVARSNVVHRPFVELEKKFVEACRAISAPGRSERQP